MNLGGAKKLEISEFNKSLKERNFKNLYFFCGEEEYLKELYIKRLISAVVPKEAQSFNLFKFKQNFRIEDIVNSIENVPVFSEYKVVFLDNIEIFKQDANFRDSLLSCILDIPPYTILIIKETKSDEKTKLGKEIKNKGAIIKCDYPSPSDMRSFIASQFNKHGKKISVKNAEKIINECEKDMNTVVNLIEAVSAYMGEKEEVTENILDIFIIPSTDSAIYDLTDSVITGNSSRAYEILKNLLLFPKNTPQSLFTAISNHISSLFIIKTCMDAGISQGETLKYLSGKFPPFLMNKYRMQIKNIPSAVLEDLLSFCAESDYKLKNGLIRDKLMPIYQVIGKLKAK